MLLGLVQVKGLLECSNAELSLLEVDAIHYGLTLYFAHEPDMSKVTTL